eukprot:3451080-Prorocentrum_lima.AAC.1
MATTQRGVPMYHNRALWPVLFAWKEAKPFQQFLQVMQENSQFRRVYCAWSDWLKMAAQLCNRVVGKWSYKPP